MMMSGPDTPPRLRECYYCARPDVWGELGRKSSPLWTYSKRARNRSLLRSRAI